MEILKMLGEVLVCWLVAYFVSGVVHEGGHVVAGLLQGWKFEILVVGPFKLYRDEKDDKVKFGLEKNLMLWCGIGGTLPREEREDNLQKFARVLLAGPIASLILGLLCSISLFFGVSIWKAMMTFVPIAMGIACLIPNAKTGILYTDGGRFLRIVKGGKTQAEEKAVFDATFHDTFHPGSRYDEAGIEAMTTSEDVSFQYMGHYYAYLNAKMAQDQEGMQASIASMESLKTKVSKFIKETYVLEN
jgi:hypothetical protein